MGARALPQRGCRKHAKRRTQKPLCSCRGLPDLKANQNFLDLQTSVADTEDKIQAARRFTTVMCATSTPLCLVSPQLYRRSLHFTAMEYSSLTKPMPQPASQLKFSFNGNTLHSPRRNIAKTWTLMFVFFVPRHRLGWAISCTLTAPAF